MLLTELHHVQLAAPVGCEPEARRFFGELLGLEEIKRPEVMRSRAGCWFRVGAGQLHIGTEEPFRPAHSAHPAFVVSDIDAVVKVLEQEGIACTWAETLGAVRRFHASDPWGNRLEFTEPT